jgi:hypothetical protein
MVDDPALVIGSAKELVESTAKAVLTERGWSVNDKDDLPALVSQAQRALALHPSQATPGPDGTEAVKKILGGMTTIIAGLGELRSRGYGTGHGPASTRVGLRARHAHMAVNAAVTWCQLTLADGAAPWRQNPARSTSLTKRPVIPRLGATGRPPVEYRIAPLQAWLRDYLSDWNLRREPTGPPGQEKWVTERLSRTTRP